MNIKTPLIGFALVLLVPALALAAQVSVSLGAGSISPSTVTVNAGDTVVWTNTSNTTQSVMADGGAFQSGSIAAGGQFAATFNSSGTYNYYDSASGSAILGTIIVGGTSVSTAPSTTYINPNTSYQAVSNPGSNSTLASLEAEVQSLIAEINALEGNSSSAAVAGSPTYVTGACPQIGRTLSLGDSGSDVTGLQGFLGVSPATGYYGAQTQTAVEQWQAANNIISSGTAATTGYGVVGPRTEAAIRLACSGGSSSTTSASGSSGVVSGYLQVTPISGSAPLTVTANVTVNAAGTCAGTTYTLNFGDNSPQQVIPLNSGNCSPQNESVPHTYTYGGTYTVTLSAGTHASTATVSVSGPTAPASGSTGANGSITAVVSSGNAPFNATFYVSCTSGQAYDVNFGDGTDLGSSGVSQSSCNGNLQAVTHTYKSAGTYGAQLIIFVQNSSGGFSQQAVATQNVSVTAVAPAASTYSTPTLTPDAAGNPLEVSLAYSYDSSGCETSINWGDGQTTGPSGCSTFTGQLQTFTQAHTYAAAGSYSITLTRGTQTYTVGVTIQ